MSHPGLVGIAGSGTSGDLPEGHYTAILLVEVPNIILCGQGVHWEV